MEDMLDFCLRYFWVYNCKMTELFVDKPWTNMPHEWLEVFNSMSINGKKTVGFTTIGHQLELLYQLACDFDCNKCDV